MELAVTLLSSSFLFALVFGGIAGKLAGHMLGVAVGMVTVGIISLAAAWIAWQAGPQPERGMVRVEGVVARPATAQGAADWGPEVPAWHEYVIRYPDHAGQTRELPANHSPRPVAPDERLMIDYAADGSGEARVADIGTYHTLLMVFVLFGAIPLAMSSVVLASLWEQRPGARSPAPRPPALRKACTVARITANVALLIGFYVTFTREGIEAIAEGFPIIGGASFAHGAIGIVAGLRLSAVLIFWVVAVGFVGFGLFARTTQGFW